MASLLRRRRHILLLSAAALSTYAIYKAYKKRRTLLSIFETLVSVAESISSSAQTLTLLSSDLNRFLRSNSDEIPTSLKQISKLATSDEFFASVSNLSQALTVGIVRGTKSGSDNNYSSEQFIDRFLDKLLSDSGSEFASIVVGSFARNLVVGYFKMDSGSDSVPNWIPLICVNTNCRELIADCVRNFVSSAVAVYLDKTMEINMYDEFFAAVTNPNHEAKVRGLMVSVCNNAVETLVRTAHQVMTNGASSSLEQKLVEKEDGGGWFDQVSTTLAVPSNRRLVLDVTGRVTFETVRSFLEFLLWKLYDGARRGVVAISEGVLERGVEVVRYFSAKSMLLVTVCLALCMRVFAGTSVLMPA